MRPSPDGSRRHSFQNFLHPDANMSSAPSNSSNNVSNFIPLQKSTSRTRLNLLNPMNLLARRRSAQGVPAAKATSKESRMTVGYEGIRGTKVHDFSAPRPKPQTVETQPVFSTTTYAVSGGRDEGDGGYSAHTPVFKEDFEDGQSLFPAAGRYVRKPTDFSDLVAPMPAYAKNNELPAKPRSPPEPETGTLAPSQQSAPTAQDTTKRPVLEERTVSYDRSVSEEVNRIPIGGLEIGSEKKPLVDAETGRPRNVSNASLKGFSSMKHMKSNSSRFSFDMIGAATQEKLLEDRHREKAAESQYQPPTNDPYDEEDENGFDYDDMMDDDGMEERIPGVNADLNEEDEDAGEFKPNAPARQSLNGFTFHPINTSTLNSPISSQGLSQPTPRDSRGDVIGAALTMSPVLLSPNPLQQQSQQQKYVNPEDSDDEEYSEHVRMSLETDLEEQESTQMPPDTPPQQQTQKLWQTQPLPSQSGKFEADDDMYFDDGTFGFSEDGEEAIPYAGVGDFDESVFDNNDTDEYGRPLKQFDSSIPTTTYSPPGLTDEASRRESEEVKLAKAEKEMATFAEGMSAFGLAGNLQPQPSIVGNGGQLQPTMSLTQDTLNAHLQALAEHTQAALSSGRFRRSSDEGGGVGINPHYQPQYQFNTDNALADEFEDAIEDDFDYNDEFDEDDLIASANAEALANDAGFYAQEFGFYSQPAMNAQADGAVWSNGGYFGPSGARAITINRSKSGRVLEPNLTPITERSEYSNRNSIMSLPQLASQHGGSMVGSPGGLGPNIGLAQIAGMLREEDAEDGMTMGALLRLRNKKWGGSQNSLSLSGQTPDHNRLSASNPSIGMGQGLAPGNVFFSPPLRDDEASSPQWTHTPWQQPQQIISSSPEMTKLEMQREAYGLEQHRHKSRHKRKGSAFSLHSEGEHGKYGAGYGVGQEVGSGPFDCGDNISPTLTFSPPTPAERSGMHTKYSEQSVQSDNYFSQSVRPYIQSRHHSSNTITQQQAISPTSANSPTNDIPVPPNQLRHSLDLRPQSPTHNLASAIGLVNPSVQTFDSEVSFFTKKGTAPIQQGEYKKHKHTGSSESVSYTKVPASPEDVAGADGAGRWDGGERWVIERRRTDEMGGEEVERELVEGGRI